MFSKSFPFEIGDVWYPSTFQLDDQRDTLFRPLETDLPVLEHAYTHGLLEESFENLELRSTNGIGGQRLEDLTGDATNPTAVAATDPFDKDPSVDVWSLDATLNAAKPTAHLQTWEAFDRKDVPHSEHVAYLSEASQNTFDAAVRRYDRRPAESGVLPQDVALRALCNLVLGRSSLFFHWDASQRCFIRTLADIPISGYSAASSDSVFLHLLEFGTTIRSLDDYGRSSHPYRYTCTAITALKGCVVNILDCIERHITQSIPRIRSVLQLQSATERSHQLLKILRTLINAVRGLRSDEDVISVVSEHVDAIVTTHTCFARTLQSVLARISAPWLERLCVDLGLSEDQLYQNPVDDLAHPADVQEELDLSERHGNLNADQLPNFIDNDDRILITECKQSLAALRRHLPERTLVLPESTKTRSTLWELEGLERPVSKSHTLTSLDEPETLAWSDHDAQVEYLGALGVRMSQPPDPAPPEIDELRSEVDNLLENASIAKPSSISGSVQLGPIEKLRPTIQAHLTLINETLLRHVFWSCQLRHHLDLQHQFHLFGNGHFVVRLSTALFSEETQSAERRRGNVPTGETMGLRLGTRGGQRWPPASSELRLTLDGVLSETHRNELSKDAMTRGPHKDLPGGLSFSIRELPDDEIERVLDAGSIYALDFIRLQYTTPPGLEGIITPSCMQIYDRIFRHLLRMLRVLDVTTRGSNTSRMTAHNRSIQSANAKKFYTEAHHFTCTLMSHAMDVGIQTPWKAFMASVSEAEFTLSTEEGGAHGVPLVGLDGLRRLHEKCLETMRTRLFLQRKHEKVFGVIEAALTAVLQCNACLEKGEAERFQTAYAEFEQRIAELLEMLRTNMNRPGKINTDLNAAEAGNEMMPLLFERLNWNKFYGS